MRFLSGMFRGVSVGSAVGAGAGTLSAATAGGGGVSMGLSTFVGGGGARPAPAGPDGGSSSGGGGGGGGGPEAAAASAAAGAGASADASFVDGESLCDDISVGSSEYSSAAPGGWALKLKSFLMGTMGAERGSGYGGGGLPGLPSAKDAALMSTEERLESLRAHASACADEAEAARLACVEAWAKHARARARFGDHVAGAVAIFQEIDRRRSLEMCDSMRRYTVLASSMLANLQYDVQRLAATIEAGGLITLVEQ